MKALWIAALLAAPLAHAHITVAPATAPAGAHQTLVFKVGHGCAGSATTGITVQLPEGVTAKPMPKPGWTITLAPREINWRGGPLPDAYYDEFTLQARLPEAPGRLVFKVGQQCEKGRMDWADVAPESKTPAPVLEVLPAAMPMHHH
ncbi:YcnI family protein [Massilia sp. CT11-108]|uniref:YcnI family copper-binding membrane protein n=1 Tax=Massilia sp. CT11-108 TaxID=3393900 RepID=UPI0039A56A8B